MTELSPGTHLVPDGTAASRAARHRRQAVPVHRGAAGLGRRPARTSAPGEEGEIWIRGPQRMKGYFGRQEETDTLIDADGWLHTGDIGRSTSDGWCSSSTGSRS